MSSKELIVSQSQHETKVGILEDGQLVEVYFQRANEYSLAGSIHKGRVTRVLPGMQSAFVDLGLERDTFLYVSDFFDEHGEDVERIEDQPAPSRERERARGRSRDRDRDRDRGRDRERPAVAEAAPAAVAEPAAAEPAPEAQAATGEDAQDRRGRRSRRRRRGSGKGFPDSKYATPADGEDEAVSEPAGEEVIEVIEAAEPEPESAPAPAADAPSDIFVLPGESLAKYRRAAASAVVVEAAEEAPAELSLDQAADEAAEEAMEQLLDRVEDLEQAEEIAAKAEPVAERAVEEPVVETEAAEDATSDAEPETVEEAAPDAADIVADSSGDDVAEAVEAEAAGEPVDFAAEASEESASADDSTNLTATVRAQGDRAGHRVSRRSRRRGRGSDRSQPQAAETEAAEPRVEAPVERVEARPAVEPQPESRERRERPPLPSISDLLKEGQEIIVQIAKEPLGQKGARITSHIALPGRYVVYMPTVDHFGVSRKISTDEERQRLKKILQKHKEGVPGGYIMRTAGEGRTEDEIAADMNFLANLWQDIRNKADKRRAPALLHHDVEVVERLLRDQLTEGFKAVWVDNEDLYEQVLHSTERLAPALLSRIKLYTRPEPIFDAFGITQELEKALRPKVWLKSGGYIVINQTEALVAIDVNTGKYVGKSNRLEDTIVKTNTEAVKEIVRQVRLRDLGGIIVVDFIDMDERKNRQKVMQALEDAMKADKAPYKILQFNDFGLVAITRKRVKQSLERTLCSPCPHCEGAGYVKSVQTVIGEILGQAQKYAKVVDGKDCLLRVNPDVAKVLKSVENKYLEELEETLGRPVLVTADPLLHQEKFDLT